MAAFYLHAFAPLTLIVSLTACRSATGGGLTDQIDQQAVRFSIEAWAP